MSSPLVTPVAPDTTIQDNANSGDRAAAITSLTVFQSTSDTDFQYPAEWFITTNTSPIPPGLNEPVSMGLAYDWRVIEVVEFAATASSPVQRIHVATVQHQDRLLLPRDRWLSVTLNHALILKVDENLQLLEFALAVDTTPPPIGEPIYWADSERDETGRVALSPTQWSIQSVDSFSPTDNLAATHYPIIHLAWCKA